MWDRILKQLPHRPFQHVAKNFKKDAFDHWKLIFKGKFQVYGHCPSQFPYSFKTLKVNFSCTSKKQLGKSL